MGDDRLGVRGRREIDAPLTEPAEQLPSGRRGIQVCAWRLGTRYVAASQRGHHH